MRSLAIFCVVPLAICITCPARGVELLYDGFGYAVGETLNGEINTTNIGGDRPWLISSLPAGDVHIVQSDNFAYPGLPAPTGGSVLNPRVATGGTGVNRITLPNNPYTRGSGATVYFSFTMKLLEWDNISDVDARNTTHRRGGFFAGFHGGAASLTTGASVHNGYAGEVFIRRELDFSADPLGVQTGRYELGIAKNLHNSPAPTMEPTFYAGDAFEIGEQVFIVGQYQFVDLANPGTADIARLWINPTPGDLSVAGTPTIQGPAGASNMAGTLNIESFYLRGDTNAPGDLRIDELRVGTTFADVVPESATGLDGDFNHDDVVDGADFLVWQQGGSPVAVSSGDLADWRANFGQSSGGVTAVPEPATISMAVFALACAIQLASRRSLKQI